MSVRQAVATLAIALLLGLVAGCWDMWSNYRERHDSAQSEAHSDLNLVRGLAIEAAYQLSTDLAGEVVNGLARERVVAEVKLTDNYGGVLGHVVRPAVETPFPALAKRLFGDVAEVSLALEARSADGSLSGVGTLVVRLDPGWLMNQFLERVLATVLGGATRAVLLCALVVAVFYLLITKPLLRIISAIAKVDPLRPGAFLIDPPPSHENDELGLLASTVNAMLAGSQDGLHGRDQAESALAALARDLEQRVADRTNELAREKEGVERTLAQLNVVNAELERASRYIKDGIQYASRIQTALLPDLRGLEGVVAGLAVGWQPLDVVGGDYYWAGRFDTKVVFVMMDCTGHGVPGAFMTAVAAAALSRVLHHSGHDDPARILVDINRLVKAALKQDRTGATSNDGLDAAVCVLDLDTKVLRFAGANQSLLVSCRGAVHAVAGNRASLGYADSPDDYTFTTHTISCGPGDVFYLYTDGIVDQVGGPNGRLFGRRKLQETLCELAGLSLDDQLAQLFRRLESWRDAESRRDDMTFLAVQAVRS